MAKKKKKEKPVFVVLVLSIVFFLTFLGINKDPNFTKFFNNQNNQQYYIVEEFDIETGKEEIKNPEKVEKREERLLELEKEPTVEKNPIKNTSIRILTSPNFESNNQRLASRAMNLPQGQKPYIMMHHTASFASDNNMASFLQGTLSVQIMIGKDGRIVRFADFMKFGAHHVYEGINKGDARLYSDDGELIMNARSLNRGSIGIEINHGVRWKPEEMALPDDTPSEEQLRGIANFFIYLWKKYEIGPNLILTHSEVQTYRGEREKEPRGFFFYRDSIQRGFLAHPNLIKICNMVKEAGAWNTGQFATISGEDIAYGIIHNNVRAGKNYLEVMIREGRSGVDQNKLREYKKTLEEYDKYKFKEQAF